VRPEYGSRAGLLPSLSREHLWQSRSAMISLLFPDSGSTTQIWLALAKPNQALTLVLAAVPEGWTARIIPKALTEDLRRTFEEVKLKPGEVYRLPS
jgi:hypothetical protein